MPCQCCSCPAAVTACDASCKKPGITLVSALSQPHQRGCTPRAPAEFAARVQEPQSSPAALQFRGTTRAAALAEGQPGDAGLGFTGPECKIIISGFPFVSVVLYSHLPGHANDADCASPGAVRLKHEKTTCACYHHPAHNIYKPTQLMLMLQGVSVGRGAFPRCCEIPAWRAHGQLTLLAAWSLHPEELALTSAFSCSHSNLAYLRLVQHSP